MQTLNHVEDAVTALIERVGTRIVMGIPLGLGKPNQFVNALYRYAKQHPEIQLKIITALSLDIPSAKPGLEQRFAEPLFERLFGDYERLDYIADVKAQRVPNNIEISEFFFKPGEHLKNQYAQQNYISSNYTHVARDLIAQGVNVVAQLIAKQEQGDKTRYSLSCNPDVTLDLVEMLEQEACFQGKCFTAVGQVHNDLPFMVNDAEVDADYFDIIIDNPEYDTTLFATPNGAVNLTDHLIGLYASTLIKDNGTLQIGIGSMADALVHACLLRHQHNADYQNSLSALAIKERYSALLDEFGGIEAFDKGLYGSSEMFVNGFRHLIDGGVIKRKIFNDLEKQLKANNNEKVDDADGLIMHGGFFLGPRDFYTWLKQLPDAVSQQISMSSIGYINQLTHAPQLLRAQRQHARFINTGLIATLGGAVCSDGLDDGKVLSGVGGQYNFVAMAHQLADARSILMIRSTRGSGKKLESNIRFNYGHTTIPRHLRDIVITEYGIADLRSLEDEHVYKAMLNIADSRFQPELLAQAKAAGKVPQNYQIPAQYQSNTPEQLRKRLNSLDKATHFPEFPLGHDFTEQELELIRILKKMKQVASSKLLLAKTVLKALSNKQPLSENQQQLLDRMQLTEPQNLQEKIWRLLILHFS